MSLPVYPDLPGLTFPVDKTPSFANLTQSAPNGLDVVIQQNYNPIWKWTLIYEFLRDDPTRAAELIGGYTEYQTFVGFLLSLAASAGAFLLRDRKDNAVGPGVTGGSTPNPAAALQLIDDGAGTWYSPIQRNFGGQFFEDITDLNGAISVYANGTLKALTTDYTIVGPGLALAGNSFMGLVIKWNNGTLGPWLPGHGYNNGDKILDPAGHIQKVTSGGCGAGACLSGATMPTWNDTGGTTTDNVLTWTDQGYTPAPATPITAAFQFYFRARFAEDSLDISQWDAVRWTIGGTDAGQSEYVVIKSARPDFS